jgi:hypothetical protein
MESQEPIHASSVMTEPAGEHTFFDGKRKDNHELESYLQLKGLRLLVAGCYT